jgi:hypothetical protein
MTQKANRLLNDMDGWCEDMMDEYCAEYRDNDNEFDAHCPQCPFCYGVYQDRCNVQDMKNMVSQLRSELSKGTVD